MYIPQRNKEQNFSYLEPPERTQIGHHQRCSVAHTAGGVDTCMLVSADAFSWLSSVTRGQEPAFFFNISEFLALVLLQSLQSSSVIWNTPVVGPVEAELLETRSFSGVSFFYIKAHPFKAKWNFIGSQFQSCKWTVVSIDFHSYDIKIDLC